MSAASISCLCSASAARLAALAAASAPAFSRRAGSRSALAPWLRATGSRPAERCAREARASSASRVRRTSESRREAQARARSETCGSHRFGGQA